LTTYAFTAKGALFDALTAYTAPAQPLDGIQVEYAYPGSIATECIYGGGVRFEHRDVVAEAPGVMIAEESLVSIYIRVVQTPVGDVRDTDNRALEIGQAIAQLLRSQPTLAGGNAVMGIARGQGDYTQTDDETISILAYQIRVVTTFSYGSP
jgi:hypothetical protein